MTKTTPGKAVPHRSFRESKIGEMHDKFDQYDGRPKIDANDKLLAKLYEIHRKPRPDLVDLGMADRPPKYRLRHP
ncbi:MAG TPA: hypothetical protein VNG33_17740 [Polyangiaceae bacterium]|nr:hypothetical protein [Polyangiaceae bacterium]